MRQRLPSVAAVAAVALLACEGRDRARDQPAAAKVSETPRPAPVGSSAADDLDPALSGTIVYARGSGHDGRVWALELPDGEPRALTETGHLPLATGPLVTVRSSGEGSEEKLHITGPEGLVSAGPPSSHIRAASWSPARDWLVYESSHLSFRDLYRLDVESGRIVRLTDDREGNFEPRVSPDGERIAFVSSRDGNTEIYAMNARGEEELRLTAFHYDDWAPRWSPDGAWLAFSSDREGPERLFVMRPDGSGQRRLTDREAPGGEETDLAWSPDGSQVAYALRGVDGSSRIFVVELSTGVERPLSPPDARDAQPSWSPDGEHLVFSAIVGSGEPDLHLVSADGGDRRRLTRSAGADWQPVWRAPARRRDERPRP